MNDLQERIKEKQRQLRELMTELSALIKEQEEIEKKQFFNENEIFKEDVQLGHCHEIPTFSHVREFLRWLKDNKPHVKWYEWNGMVFSVEKALDGELKEVCKYEDLEYREDPYERMKRELEEH